METMKEYSLDKCKPSNKDFNRFVNICAKELKKYKSTICYSMEQVEALKSKFDISVTIADNVFYVKHIGG